MVAHVLVLPGDGIGPEVMDQALRVLEASTHRIGLAVEVHHDVVGGQAWDRHGTFCRDDTVDLARTVDGVLVGAVGGPAYDHLVPDGTPEEKDGLMRLRSELQVFAGLRPARARPHLVRRTPFRPDVVSDADVLVLREMCGGVMFATPRGIDRSGTVRRAVDTTAYDAHEIERHARVGFELARRRRSHVTSVDKANVMESGVLWREVVAEVAADYPDVECVHLYADICAYQLSMDPRRFDVIVADTLFGDILSDQAGAIAGSIGLLASACLPGLDGGPGIYEPVHGSAPDIAGLGTANPIGMIMSVAMLLDHGLGRPDMARSIEDACDAATAAGVLTADLGGTATTVGMTDAVLQELQA